MMRRTSNSVESINQGDSPVEEGLEKGTLSIRTNGNITDIWHREIRRKNENDNVLRFCFEIPFARVMPTLDNLNTNVKKYIIYDVSICQDTRISAENSIKSNDEPAIIIERRYTDFRTLYDGLRKDHAPLLAGVQFPKKVLMGNFSSDLIADRSGMFEMFLDHIVASSVLRESMEFLNFLQAKELSKACQLLDERRNEQAVPILENCFRLLNKVYNDRSKSVLLILCRLVIACTTSPIPHPMAERWCELALHRYEGVSDADLLVLYIPLLQSCVHLWWQRGRDSSLLNERLLSMEMRGIRIKGGKTLTQALHAVDPRGETN